MSAKKTVSVTPAKGEFLFNEQDLPGRPAQEVLRSLVYTPANATGEFYNLSTAGSMGDSLTDCFSAVEATWWHFLSYVSFENRGSRLRYVNGNPDRLNGWDGMIHEDLIYEALQAPTLSYPNNRVFRVNGERFIAPIMPDGEGGFVIRRDIPSIWLAVKKTVSGMELHLPPVNDYGKYPSALRALYCQKLNEGARISVDVTTRWYNDKETGERKLGVALQERALYIQKIVALPREDALAQIRKDNLARFETARTRQALDAVLEKPRTASHTPTKREAGTVVVVDGAELAVTSVPAGEYSLWFNGRQLKLYFPVSPAHMGTLLDTVDRYGKGLELKTL